MIEQELSQIEELNKSHQDEEKKEPSQIDEKEKSQVENMMQAEEEA